MNWDAKDKLAARTFYIERLKQSLMITHTPAEDKVTHILLFGCKEASERWATLKDQLHDTGQKNPTALRRAPQVGKQGMSTLETSSRPSIRPQLN